METGAEKQNPLVLHTMRTVKLPNTLTQLPECTTSMQF